MYSYEDKMHNQVKSIQSESQNIKKIVFFFAGELTLITNFFFSTMKNQLLACYRRPLPCIVPYTLIV